VEILTEVKEIDFLRPIELAGRTCYKSEDKISEQSCVAFAKRAIINKHFALLEHAPSVSIRFICDRGVANELTRHRIGISFTQESTRYCNYTKDKFDNQLTFIRPYFWDTESFLFYSWERAMKEAEHAYTVMIQYEATPQQARTVLPLSLKTELYMTANIRALRNILELRCDKAAHPQMRQIMLDLLNQLYKRIPSLLFDIYHTYEEEILSLK